MRKNKKSCSISEFCRNNNFRTLEFYKMLSRHPELARKMKADVAEALLKNADFVEDLFTDEAFVKEICGENRTFAEKFVDALKSIIEAIKNYLTSGD